MNDNLQRPYFPPSFVWGVATSAFQIEGATQSDGRGPSIWDTFSHTPGKVIDGSNGDVACDHYHRFRDDVKLMAALGLDAYRFSISWPRMQPKGQGGWNEKGLAFYDALVDELLAHGIKPYVTLYHWDLPQQLQDSGGWQSRDTTLRFADYALKIAQRFGDRVKSIATLNEPWCVATLGHELGRFAPGLRSRAVAAQVSHHLLLAHGLAITAMRTLGNDLQLGIVLNLSPSHPATDSEADRRAAQLEDGKFVRWYMDPIFRGQYPQDVITHLGDDAPLVTPEDMDIIRVPIDFLGVNYYTRIYASAENPPRKPPGDLGVSDMGWENYPAGLTELLERIAGDYSLPPIYITENGTACADRAVDGRIADAQRIDYVASHLQALATAIERGVDVRGYFYWSLMDNFEWDSGYAKRFGLAYVDYLTQQRMLKDSAYWYRDFIAAQRATTVR